MLWVVLGHAPLGEAGAGPVWENAIYDTAYSFHMSLFMLISGFLFCLTRLSPTNEDGSYRWTYLHTLGDKALRLLVPMAFFTLFAFALKWLFPSEVDRAVNLSLADVGRAFLFPYDGPLREMWFIYTLFLLFVLMPVWRLAIKNTLSVCLTLVVLLGCCFWDPDLEFLSAGRVASYGFWFFSGIVLAKYDVLSRLLTSGQAVLLLCGGAAAAAGHLTGSDFAVTAGYIAVSLALAMLLDRFVPKIFRSFRNYTYQIFLMGIFAQMAVKIAFRHFSMPYVPAYLLCVAAGLYVPVLIALSLEKINCPALLAVIGLKPQKK